MDENQNFLTTFRIVRMLIMIRLLPFCIRNDKICMAKIWLFIYTSNSLTLLSKSNISALIRMKSELRHSPDTILLDREIVFVHLYSEEPCLTPVGSPTVSSNPVLCPCFCNSASTNLEVKSNESLTFEVGQSRGFKCIPDHT